MRISEIGMRRSKMSLLEKQLKNSEKWKNAEKDLKNFNEMIKLIEKYPVKLIYVPVISLPYKLN